MTPAAVAACLAAMLPAPAADAATTRSAPQAVAALPSAGEGVVAHIESGHALTLADGRRIRLAGILAPLPDPREPAADGLAQTARAALRRRVDGRGVEIRLAAAKADRYGRVRAHLLRRDDGLWLQAALLRAGHVQVFTTPETAAAATALYAAEDEARQSRRGLWASARYRPADALRVKRPAGRFTIVRGRVREAAKVGGTLYLNFGEDWREDFTLRLPWEARRRFPVARREAGWWMGRCLEMRGMLESYNGPMITAREPAAIRLLGEPKGRPTGAPPTTVREQAR